MNNRLISEVFYDNYSYMIRYLSKMFEKHKKSPNDVFNIVKEMIMRSERKFNIIYSCGFLFGCIAYIYEHLDILNFENKYGTTLKIISAHACVIEAKEPYEYKNDMKFTIPNFRANSNPEINLFINDELYGNMIESNKKISQTYMNSIANILASIIEAKYKADDIVKNTEKPYIAKYDSQTHELSIIDPESHIINVIKLENIIIDKSDLEELLKDL